MRLPIRWLAWGGTAVAGGTLAAMAGLFLVQSLPVWRQEGLGFLSGVEWFYRAGRFGAAPMIYGTAAVAAIAVTLAWGTVAGHAVRIARANPVLALRYE